MKAHVHEEPRRFTVGLSKPIELCDCAHITLEADEQVTFVSEGEPRRELDVVRKSWGYYATPSLNGRLPRMGLRAALVRNRLGHFFVVLIESGKEAAFAAYAAEEELTHVTWMDSGEALERISDACRPASTGGGDRTAAASCGA